MSLPPPLAESSANQRIDLPPSPRGPVDNGSAGGAVNGKAADLPARFGQVLRRHCWFLAILAAGLVLRILVLIAYPQAFWYTDSTRYESFSHGWQIDFARQAGYSMFLKALHQTGSLYSVSVIQHLLGLAITVAVYAFLQRRSVPRWLSILAVAPLLFDGFQLTFEHYVLAETVFSTLLVAGLLALVWPVRLSAWSAGLAGLLLALSSTVRAVSLPLVIVTVGYFIFRRPGWRPVISYALCATLPLLGYVMLFHHKYDRYTFSTVQGSYLYGRIAPIADCEHLELTAQQRAICPKQPVDERPVRSDWYIFSPDSPARGVDMDTQQGFAFAVLRQQPRDVARAIIKDVGKYLLPSHVHPDWACVTTGTLLPAQPPGSDYDWCKPNPRQAFSGTGNPDTQPGTTSLTRALGGYAHLIQTPKLLLGGCVVLVVTGLIWRPRRRPQHSRLADIALVGGWGLGLIVLGVTGSMFDERYGIPSLAVLPAAGALALHGLNLTRWRGADRGTPAPEEARPGPPIVSQTRQGLGSHSSPGLTDRVASRPGGATLPGAEAQVHEPPRLPLRRSRLRMLVPSGMLLVVLVPMVVHVTRLDAPDSSSVAGAHVHTFYVSPDGDDSRSGSSAAEAWRSLTKADSAVLRPGDKLLLRGGARFRGSIGIGSGEAGKASNPVVVGSYGSGRATIESTGFSGIAVYNTAGIEIRDLAIVGDADAYAQFAGIKLYSNLPGDRKLDHVVISHVDIAGFKKGIDITGGNGLTGFRNVNISDAVLHGNRDAGLTTTGPAVDPVAAGYAHEAVTVSGVSAYDNRGNPDDHWNTTGNGIVLSSVRRGLIERSTAHDNGSLCDSLSGPVGIWAFDSAGIVIAHNVSFRNHTAGGTDGGGFGLDRNASSSILQYNLSYDNDGAGYLIYNPPASGANTDSVVRFNISDNDARKLPSYAGIRLGGIVDRAQIYHNTVVIRAGESGSPPALRLDGLVSETTIRNNVFMAVGAESVASARYSTAQVLLQGNDLFNVSGPPLISWGSSSYDTLADWRFATGQEQTTSRDTGQSRDPGFVATTVVGSDGAVNRARAFVPGNRSPLVGRALDLKLMFAIDPGPVDYFGRPTASPTAVGAAQPGS